MHDLENAQRLLRCLSEISKLLITFESIEKSVDAVLGLAAKALPLRSAMLLEEEQGGARMIIWESDGADQAAMHAAKAHAERAYRYFLGKTASFEETIDRQRFIVIPLVVARQTFGVLQLEGAASLGEADLVFVNAIANQLALALDRHRAWTRAIRLREEVLGIVSHDLRNPLATILMSADLLAKDSVSNPMRPAVLKATGRIDRAARLMLRLAEDLIDFASIEAGRLSIDRRPHDPSAMLRETAASFEAMALAKKVRLVIEVDPDLPAVICDRDRILQVLSNLVGNAVKVTSNGLIRLHAGAKDDEMLFAVSDTGPGVGAEELEHIFERYWRSAEVRYRGTGLGLAIARGIVDAHDGRIWAESRLGEGATFFFTLPVIRLNPSDREAQAHAGGIEEEGQQRPDPSRHRRLTEQYDRETDAGRARSDGCRDRA